MEGMFLNANQKNILIVILVGIIGVMAGSLWNKELNKNQSGIMQMPASDEKLAKSYKEDNLVKNIRDNAKELQVCYLSYLDTKPGLKEGTMNLLIKVEENGQLSDVQITRDQFENKDFESCLIKKIEKFYFNPPPLGINRYISHELGFKSEETALKESKERLEKNRPPKVLPVDH